MSETKRKAIMWAVILSESSHVFCCVLPVLFSVFSLMAGAGMVSLMPGFLVDLHDMLHAYEVPMIMMSGLILAFGWGLHLYSKTINCSETGAGCCDAPCAPKKDKVKWLLVAATLLFTVNVTVYTFVHVPQDRAAHEGHYDHHGHDH